MSGALDGLVARLALSDEEVLAIFDLDALGAIAGEVEHRPELEILDALTSATGFTRIAWKTAPAPCQRLPQQSAVVG